MTNVTMRACVHGEIHPKGIDACVGCDEDTYVFTAGEERIQCSVCPVGAACAGGSHVVARQGQWRFGPNHVTFFECAVAPACVGYDASVTATTVARRLTFRALQEASTGQASGNRSHAVVGSSRAAAKRAAAEGCAAGYVVPQQYDSSTMVQR